MKLVFKFHPTLNELQKSIIEELSFHTTKLYNIANYECRENGFRNYYEMEKQFKDNWHNDFLHSHTYQQCLKMVEQNWKAYFEAIKDYRKHPDKYLGEPQRPGFKNIDKGKNEAIFTNLAIRFKDNTLKLSLSKAMQANYNAESLNFEVPEKLQSIVNWNAIQQVRIQWINATKEWVLLIIYKGEEKKNTGTNIMSIDLGLDNLATITFKDNDHSYIIDGKVLKSVNSYANKEIARLTSIGMKQQGNPKDFKRTKQIKSIQAYRNNYVNNYLHKASRQIIDLALENKVGTILIGDIQGIKQESPLKTFVQIPVQRLVKMIEYKANLEGSKVILLKEFFTSGCSSLDLEPLTKASYDKSRRIVRGLFETSYGLINSDVNGSLNIMRRYLKDRCIPKLIELARDKGVVKHPWRIRVA